ncbi:hva22-like protein i [Anaeramoeba ignava]|uniref:Hva22-like protein i n=1 Tax=Anaeramoeba ignava TaxID=1746090 RepID=A0A9Q0L6S9_ANAIG|nr:hva22-like protein i [Anaeramoeba ignava]
MASHLISKLLIFVFGWLIPIYVSLKNVQTNQKDKITVLFKYWVFFSSFKAIETFGDLLIAWIPFYFWAKSLMIMLISIELFIYKQNEQTEKILDLVFQPITKFVNDHEPQIEKFLTKYYKQVVTIFAKILDTLKEKAIQYSTTTKENETEKIQKKTKQENKKRNKKRK